MDRAIFYRVNKTMYSERDILRILRSRNGPFFFFFFNVLTLKRWYPKIRVSWLHILGFSEFLEMGVEQRALLDGKTQNQ